MDRPRRTARCLGPSYSHIIQSNSQATVVRRLGGLHALERQLHQARRDIQGGAGGEWPVLNADYPRFGPSIADGLRLVVSWVDITLPQDLGK